MSPAVLPTYDVIYIHTWATDSPGVHDGPMPFSGSRFMDPDSGLEFGEGGRI